MNLACAAALFETCDRLLLTGSFPEIERSTFQVIEEKVCWPRTDCHEGIFLDLIFMDQCFLYSRMMFSWKSSIFENFQNGNF